MKLSTQFTFSAFVLAGLAGSTTAQSHLTTNPNPAPVAVPAAPIVLTPRTDRSSALPSDLSRYQGPVRPRTLGNTPPTPLTPSDVVVSQNATQNITPLNSISCNAGGLHTDNWYYRVFDVSGLGGDFVPQSVNVGIEVAAGGGDATQNIRLRVYDSADLNDTLIDANIVHESTVAVADQSATIFNIAAGGVITSGSMIVEIYTPDGQVDGESFFIGSNADGQTGPGYIRADACGLTSPASLGSIGFPNMHIVLEVNGKLLVTEETLTQNVNKDITALNSISCNAGGLHADNWYFRVFDTSAYGSFTPTSVDVGIEVAAGGGDATQPIRLRCYDSGALADTVSGTNIIYDSGLIALADVSATVMNFATTGALAATSGSLIVEVYTPDGQANGESFFIGSNANGQTAPCYIRADACGLTSPANIGSIGFPNMHIVLNVTGEVAAAPAFSNYCASVNNSSGGAAVLSATGSNSIAADSLSITAAPVPTPSFFLFYYGPTQIQTPFGNGGFQCVGGMTQRMQPPAATVANMAERTVLPGPYVFLPSTSVNFQCWFRDNTVLPDQFNTSDGLNVNFVN